MIKLAKFFCLICVIGSFSCSNDFDLIEGNVDIPIVYGLIDVQDTAHYIRLEKAFVDPDIPATELALDPNNLYYDNAVVQFVKNPDGPNAATYTLNRVDGNLEGLVREEGAFAQAPNYLYKISAVDIPLQEEDTLQLVIEIPGEKVITATTILVEQPIPTSPSASSSFNFVTDRNVSLKWTNGNFATLTSCTMKIKYRESKNGVSRDSFIVWDVFKNSDKSIFVIPGLEFFNLLANNLETDPEMDRFFLGIDYFLQSGGQEIQDFLSVSQANLGITSSGDIPVYSNLSEGRGIFGSRASITLSNLQLTGTSIEALKSSDITAPLNFR